MEGEGQEWDRRYAGAELVWTAEPNRFVVDELRDLAPGQALDAGAGEGRNAVWLAGAGTGTGRRCRRGTQRSVSGRPRLAGDGGRFLRGRPGQEPAPGRRAGRCRRLGAG